LDAAEHQEFCIGLAQSRAFARLSGDFNPLHLDPVGARRTPFGSTVVHGVHVALKALDVLVGRGLPAALEPDVVACTFSSPVRTGSTVQVHVMAGGTDGRVRVVGEVDGRGAFTVVLERRVDRAMRPARLPIIADAEWPAAAAAAEPAAGGVVELRIARRLCEELFPAISRSAPNDWVAVMLATTRIVGMECPGADSIYSSLRLQRDNSAEGARPPALEYRIASRDERFRLVKLTVGGAGFVGTIDAFVRPQPVRQAPLRDLVSIVDAGSFNGQRALVVGGSRGLGETTAKILLAGGAAVTVTYAVGRADAERTCAEAREIGRQCTAAQLDVMSADGERSVDWLRDNEYTHVYYFASPHIGKNAAGAWDEALFLNLQSAYAGAFEGLVERVLAWRAPQAAAPRFFYPSTVYLDAPEAGFAEYAAAKAAGEAVARRLAQQHAVTIAMPRLPRLRTDQTAALFGAEAGDPVPVLLDMVRRFVG
jgi:NAD(P)-dependent dehydrogenase (short-subunit alcohol dehydrogenase family)